jgi:magnesium transporter
MPYISQLLGRPIVDVDGVKFGTLRDILAATRADRTHPEAVALLVQCGSGERIIPVSEAAVLVAQTIPLAKSAAEVSEYRPGEQDIRLERDVLDKQIIDIDGVRVVRVNDLELTRIHGGYYIANVDVSSRGLMRRLLPSGWMRLFPEPIHGKPQSGIISWENVELLAGGQPMRLKVPGKRIADLHPADLAEIISDLSKPESDHLLQTLDASTVADTLEEVEPDFQASLLENMTDDKVADVLEEMAPDEAADLLGELPAERSQELLKLMHREEADGVRRLLTFPEDSAGGLMNTEFFSVPPGLTAGETIAQLRRTAHEAETIYYIYATGPDGKLAGVFSLRELVLSDPQQPVSAFMHKRVVSVLLDARQDDIAQAVSKYNLLALPVVDEQGRIQGIVTADDALDKIIPTAWKRKLPRLYH